MLVVDDDKFMRKTLNFLLIKNGYKHLHFAENGKEAIDKLENLSL